MDELTQLKAKAYDFISQIEMLRRELEKVNQQITDKLNENGPTAVHPGQTGIN